ncbi:MAG: anthraniloyl-CoA monooxygenase [Planctomycetota bacterium]|jgi:anthraniloyl-CoA monooxygenase
MKIACIGGGPGSLYFGILMKKAYPKAEITVYDREVKGQTFGWGVVFSDQTMEGFEAEDPETVAAINAAFIYWTKIDTFLGGSAEEVGAKVTSTGHGFCGMSRIGLLTLLEERAEQLGVVVEHERMITDPKEVGDVDLIVAGDGINSMIRTKFAEHFKPSFDWRPNHFCWLGTTRPLDAFTFIFKESEHGLFCVHAYPYEDGTTTWIVECQDDVFQRAGLADASEDETVAYMQDLFGVDLMHEGTQHKVLANRSIWRKFPVVKNEKWHHENMVLIGDSAHTAHFSIGSGTKLAMEDASALVTAFVEHGESIEGADVPKILAAYQGKRDEIAGRLQTTAATSLKWFEVMDGYTSQDPVTFAFNLMTRSKSITFDNLAMRDPALVAGVGDAFAKLAGAKPLASGELPPPIFTPLMVGGLQLWNRIVVSPMCQYSAEQGTPGPWHQAHYGGLALGGAGLLICEATAISAEGRITPGCTGIYTDEHTAAWRGIVNFAHEYGSGAIGLQLCHAGRKASCATPANGDKPLLGKEAWQTIGPCATPFDRAADGGVDWHEPRAMTRDDMDQVRDDFVAAALRATEAGFDLLELHMAHGYLLSTFLSPASNTRDDEYGGSFENRLRFPVEVLAAVRKVWAGPLSCRISATDWIGAAGMTGADAVQVSLALEAAGADLIDVSTGGVVPRAQIRFGRMYQTPFAEAIKQAVGIPVMAVGAIQNTDQANTLLAAGRADLCAMARPHLARPNLTMVAAAAAGVEPPSFPVQYLASKSLLRPRP